MLKRLRTVPTCVEKTLRQMIVIDIRRPEMSKKCLINKPTSMPAIFVLAGAAIGTMLLPQQAPVGAVVGGFVVLAVMKAKR